LLKNKIIKLLYSKLFFTFIILISFIYLNSLLFSKLFYTSKIEINFFTQSLDISSSFSKINKIYNILFILSFIISGNYIYSILKNSIFNFDLKNAKNISNTNKPIYTELNLLIGKNLSTNQYIYIPEKGLYQNILITGSIGSGKTSSMMYPLTKQLISYEYNNIDKKIGMLILDVKGNYHKEVMKYANIVSREDDVITISLKGKYKYNPLDKPNLKPIVLANRLKNILLLFSKNNSDSYWLDKSEQILSECIKLCRLYNNRICNFFRTSQISMFGRIFKRKNIVSKRFIF